MIASTQAAKTIFGRAIEIESPAERAAYLDEACALDSRLREEVESLLRAGKEVPVDFLPQLCEATGETRLHQPQTPPWGAGLDPAPGDRIGRYKLVELLGEGGMGQVWKAEQQEDLRRPVALKLIRAGMDSKQVVARFEQERQALALMNDENIAKALDGGTTEAGRPFFVMEYVDGKPITTYCDDNRLTPRERLGLFAWVCQAIQHAHQKGIIHRDIKPSNVLVALHDGKPVPKVIDFGIAKATEQRLTDMTIFTEYGAPIGTLEYMSPEQASLGNLDVDTRSDVYSLGVLLYELLTGSTPVDRKSLAKADFLEILRVVREVEAPRPSARLSALAVSTLTNLAANRATEPAKLSKLMKGEPDWIALKALEKDRNRRYETVSDLARDVQNYLAGDPVEACPPTAGYRLKKFLERNRGPVLAAGLVLLALVGGIIGTTLGFFQARQAQHDAEASEARSQQALVSQVVERLEGEVRQLEVLGKAMRATLEARERWTEKEVKDWLVALLHEEERVRSVSVAFEPGRLEGRPDSCPYVSRGLRGIEVTEQLPKPTHRTLARRGPRGGFEYLDPMPEDAYTPNYREWDWYRKPFGAREPLWLGPGEDLGDWTVSYCVPFRLQGEWAGVLTVDLAVGYFRRVWDWLEEARLGQKSYGFVIAGANTRDGNARGGHDRSGTFIGHPEYRPPRTIQEVADQADNPAFADLTERMLSERQGSGTAIDPWTGRRSTFLFGRVPSAGWTFVAVIEQ